VDIPWWALIVLWVVVAMLSPKKKRPPAPSLPISEPPGEGGEELGELGKALQALKQAEEKARRRPAPKPYRAEVFHPKPRPEPPKRARVRLQPARDDRSSEDAMVVSLEGRDYDEEADRVVASRRRAAERKVRKAESLESLSAEQAARRSASLGGQAIGGRAEHAEWHQRLQDTGAPAPGKPAPPNALARFATGRLQDAFVLSEILGRPLSER
jgi:hypothetical protein